jgi:hypothetical protein
VPSLDRLGPPETSSPSTTVAHFQRAMIMDVDQAAKAMKDSEIEDSLEGFNQPTYRGMRVNGVRVVTWRSQRGRRGL